MIYEVEIQGRVRRVEIERGPDGLAVSLDGHRRAADVNVINGIWSLILEEADGSAGGVRQSYEITLLEQAGAPGTLIVHVDGRQVTASVGALRSWARREQDAGGRGEGAQRVAAPMPGKVVKVLVRPGDEVSARQGVVVVEAMKMENELRAPKAGRVAEVRAAEGALVEAGAVLVVIE